MAIEFNCPHCQHPYRLPDTLAGKRATCKNAKCRQVIVVPSPATVPPTAPPPIDVEAAAMSALSDEPVAEKAPAAKEIPVECPFCSHKWTEPFAKAGKNVLCPNEDCRRRVKVPEPKEDIPTDWRQQKSKLPSMAKQNVEKLEGVQASEDVKLVSGEALKQAGAIDEGIEPRPLKQKVMFVLLGLAVVGGITAGVMYLSRSRSSENRDKLMADALNEYKGVEDAARPPGPQGPLYAALLEIAAGEYMARQNDPKKFLAGVGHFKQAGAEIGHAAQKDVPGKQSAAAERYAVAVELAAAVLVLGGTDEQAKKQVRYRWTPENPGERQLRVNEKTPSVFGQLRQALEPVRPADPDFRAATARRLTRELQAKGQTELANCLPEFLFVGDEQHEGKAVVALELFRLTKETPDAGLVQELKEGPRAGAATVKILVGVSPGEPPPPANDTSDAGVLAHVGYLLLKDGNADAAVRHALKAKPEATRLRALALCAEWAADPTPAFDEAVKLAKAKPSEGSAPLSQSVVLRLSQVAAAAGKADQAKALAAALTDEGLRAWATADALRLRLAATKEAADESAAEVPDDVKKQKVGHAWGRLSVARQNAKLGKADGKAVSGWPPGTVRPFGLAGVALGMQDRD